MLYLAKKAEDLPRKTVPDVRHFCYYRWMLTDALSAKDVRMYDLTEPIKARYDTEKDKYRKVPQLPILVPITIYFKTMKPFAMYVQQIIIHQWLG